MTPPTPGWALMRDAALSLALRHDWAGALANPRQMAPYSYAQSPISADGAPSLRGPSVGTMLPDKALTKGFLSDRMGPLFTLIWFGKAPTVAHPLLTVIDQPAEGPLARAWAAPEGSAWLIRPDLHVAARWSGACVSDILSFLDTILERQA